MIKVLSGVLIGGALCIGLASTWLFKKKPDNKIEEYAEEVIKKETGLDIDLSPGSPEPKN